MYRRTLDDKVLSFGHAGILYEQSFIMYDRQTESLWVHVTGEAVHGPLKGKRLEFMPSTVTNWANWKKNYPFTQVLPGYRRGGFMGTYVGPFRSDILGLAVIVKLKAKLYPYQVLERQNRGERRVQRGQGRGGTIRRTTQRRRPGAGSSTIAH